MTSRLPKKIFIGDTAQNGDRKNIFLSQSQKLECDKISAGDSLHLSVTVHNRGDRTSGEVIQFYLSDIKASSIVPLNHLVGFERVTLAAGESRVLKFTLPPEMMSFYNDDGKLK